MSTTNGKQREEPLSPEAERHAMALLQAVARGEFLEALHLLIAIEDESLAAEALHWTIRQQLARIAADGWDQLLAMNAVRKSEGARAAAWLAGVGDDLRAGFYALRELRYLPPLPQIGAPAPKSIGVDPKVLAKVRALLAKAESTEFPEEAEACTAKAQELMSRHAIDDVWIDAANADAPIGRHVPVEDPYAGAKATLLAKVAKANRCRVVHHPGLGVCTVLGFARDLAAVDLLYTSLLMQSTRAMLAAGQQGRYARRRGFRQAFLVSFAIRIGERLDQASRSAIRDLDAEHDGRLLPVLARRDHQVEAEVERHFPHLIKRPTIVSDPYGWSAGRAAADLADLSAGPHIKPA